MKRIALSIFAMILGIVFLLFTPYITVFSFTETRVNNPQMYYIDVSKEKIFQIRYTHSIHLTDVLETYEVTNDKKLRLISMEYEDVAVGMPAHAEEGQTLTYENGKYRLEFSNQILDNFTLYVGDIDMNLFFYYDGKSYDIKKSLHRGNSYLFEIKNISLYAKLKGVVMVHENR